MTYLGEAADVRAGRAKGERSRMAASLRHHPVRLLLTAKCGLCLSPSWRGRGTTECNNTVAEHSVESRLPLRFTVSSTTDRQRGCPIEPNCNWFTQSQLTVTSLDGAEL